ncbi:deacylase [Shouchella clausii]|uniref:Deacylase n=1 Tax=Shouchella clausii TaxID=79880 RepID=A0A268RXZ2_SHOCL|nr:M20/M25/M40 family metallo-hydrolase [Shouchella clausii]PAD41980.1 deacylase [Bacillus sp. 7520-S]MBU8598302.1 M20/M25/M40 family metallo-hydrolase [Shouchella clausii]MCY1105172.1 M20/M25/M40 family metallo-hydrolase [Shouchella clausii]MEB5478532.1 M20/M25/M40 family metallo-hydrolase [Shouchella clausii]MED4158491.1 M20/M25/M40 family metallo-hydrolase [Shouchella clausii]
MSIPAIDDIVAKQTDDSLATLFKLLRQESISTQNKGMRECAALMRALMEEVGARTELFETEGHPILYGELLTDKHAPTLLIYGHYDVQPPDPLSEWETPPFEPTVRDGRIFARGAGDNKGQIVAQLLGIKTYQEAFGALPVNIKIVIEGEEEMGSIHLPDFVQSNKELLQADLVYTADGPSHDSGSPLVLLGVRGILSFEIELQNADFDNHSGNTGNIVPNPAWDLMELLQTMRSTDGRVLIEGFYDNIRPASAEEEQLLATLPFEKDSVAQKIGYPHLDIDGKSYYRKLALEPTFNICGLKSGYLEDGIKTIIPSKASVKIDARLVVDQDPKDIFEKVTAHVKARRPDAKLTFLGAMEPSRTPIETAIVQKALEGISACFNEDPLIQPSLGGSLPDYVWTKLLQAPSLLVPYANFDQRNHSPNENLAIRHFLNGIRCTAHVIHAVGQK